MMLLQGEANLVLQIGGAGILIGNTALLLKLAFSAGEIVQTVRDHGRRIECLENNEGCTAEDCPIRPSSPIRVKSG